MYTILLVFFRIICFELFILTTLFSGPLGVYLCDLDDNLAEAQQALFRVLSGCL